MNLQTHTPHLDPAWVEAFVLALRSLEVTGPRIGAQLAELELHCADSGEDVRSAFGDPTAYAREVALAAGTPAASAGSRLRAAVSPLLGVVGLVTLPPAVTALRDGRHLDLSWGALASGSMLLLAVLLVAVYADRILPWVARHWVWATVLSMALVPTQVLMVLGARATALTLPAWPVILVGGAFLIAGLVWDLRQPRPEDEIRGPGELGGVGSVPVGRGLRALAALTPYLFILLTALMVLVSWALDR